MEYEKISKEEFRFVERNSEIHDNKLQTKAHGFFYDAFIRFKKNKSSVVAACIIGILVLFSIVSPIIAPYNIRGVDSTGRIYETKFEYAPPYIEYCAKNGWSIFNGTSTLDSQNENQYRRWLAIGQESGMPIVNKIISESTWSVIEYGELVEKHSYSLRVNDLYRNGCIYKTLSVDEFNKLQAYQDESGLQIIYPYVDKNNCLGTDGKPDPKIWFKHIGGMPVLNEDGSFTPIYSTNASKEGAPYTSSRISGDEGNYIYSYTVNGGVKCRINYYNFYIYDHDGQVPMFIFGTNSLGQDLFSAIGIGARFSLIFAILVSAINLTLGAIYGAIEGYFGGAADMIMERISDILSGVPFIVVATLFQLHLARNVGTVPSFLFAFVLTGWIGMAALTRKQFYRFKGQQYVLAARTLGASDFRLMFKHIFPNSLGTIITSCVLVIPGVIGTETSLTYLGIINLSDMFGTSIGTLISQGEGLFMTYPHAMFYPSLFLSLLLVSFNLFGNGLRDAFNPSLRGVED